MAIIRIDPLKENCYEEFVSDHPDSTVFHSSSWMSVLNSTYKFKAYSLAVVENDKIIGVLPYMETRGILGGRRWVSLPFSDFCEPLIMGCRGLESIVKYLVESMPREVSFVEIRGGDDEYFGMNCIQFPIITHDVDLLPCESELKKRFRKATQRNIKKAIDGGVSVANYSSCEAVRIYYNLHCLTRRRQGIPPQPWRFFRNISDSFIQNKNGFVTLAKYGKDYIAGAIFLTYKKKAYFKFGASNFLYSSLRPNYLTMWEAIKECRKRGCYSVNLGRTELRHTGLLQYKRGFRGTESVISYRKFTERDKNSGEMRNSIVNGIVNKFFSRVPVFVLKAVGAVLYKYYG